MKTIGGRMIRGMGWLMAALMLGGCLSEDVVRTVSVFDNQGNPIEGANVAIDGRTGVSRAMTRPDGSARIGSESASVCLVVTRPGYQLTQVADTTNLVIRVVMERE